MCKKKHNRAKMSKKMQKYAKCLQIFAKKLHFIANFFTFMRIFARVFCANISSSKPIEPT